MADAEQFKVAMRKQFDAQLNQVERMLSPVMLDLCFAYFLEGYFAATIPEYDDTDDAEYELSDALKRISPERLNELLNSELGPRQ